MRIIIVLTLMLLCFVDLPSALMQDSVDTAPSPIIVPNTEFIDITDSANGYDYRLWIGLPAGYNTSEQSYAVLYLLDPLVSFQSVTEFVRFMALDATLPQLIVVGIGYQTDKFDEINRLRERDYVRQDDDFMKFISEELFPLVDSTYQTDSADRALVGWSYGGNFVYHVLVSRPELFNRYIAIDSDASEVYDEIVMRKDAFRESFAGRNTKLFIATVGTEITSTAINNQEAGGLEVVGLSLGDVTHGQTLYFSLPQGIMAIYKE